MENTWGQVSREIDICENLIERLSTMYAHKKLDYIYCIWYMALQVFWFLQCKMANSNTG